jgi:hypothetical protein
MEAARREVKDFFRSVTKMNSPLEVPPIVEEAIGVLRHSVKFPATYINLYWVNGEVGMMIDSNLDDAGIIRSLKHLVKHMQRTKSRTIRRYRQ